MFRQYINKYNRINRLILNKIITVTKLSKEKVTYVFIVTSTILALYIINITNKQINVNQGELKNKLSNNNELIELKKFIIENIKSPFSNINYLVKSGDTLKKILKIHQVKNQDIDSAIENYKKYGKPNDITIGQSINLVVKEKLSSKKKSLHKMSIPISKSITIEISRNEQNQLTSKKIITRLYKKIKLTENKIEKSLYSSAVKVNINPNVIVEFARIFGFEIDFQRDIRKGDIFQILYESFYDENDEFVKSGSIIYAFMSVNGREIALYKFGNDKNYGYFNANGKSVEKALMKTPINGARLSSPFGMRKHPISGFNKMHQGTDFAAPSGTPIMASGTGTIILAKWCGGGGNCIKIKHNSTYSTIYAHMKSFARGMKAGKKVRQGQIIGYVGSTGISTGPHLHYEVVVNGKKVNSQKLKLPSGKVLKDKERKEFEIHRIKTDVKIAEMLDSKQ